jgi:ABC-type polysaccharide/polyol phosphate transport system ATPase subunit
MLAGVTAPTEGIVRVRGRVAPLIAVGVGFHPELTGRENVHVNGTILGLSRAEIDARFDEIVAFADIGSFIDTPVKFYSSGMFVRLGFSVSVLAEPDVLLVDEVLAVGDLGFQLRCYDRMAEIQAAGTTIVVVSHNLNAVRNMCQRTLVLHDGVVRHDGETGEAISLYHDLLAEPRSADSTIAMPTDEFRVEGSGAVERFDLLGPDGRSTRHVRSTDEATFCIDVLFERTVDNPIVSFSLYNSGGIEVYGTTTPWRGGASFAAGTSARFSVRLRMALATDSYTAHMALIGSEGVSHTAVLAPLLFYVGGSPETHGIADLDGQFDVVRGAEPA